MKCPYCGADMECGVIQSSHELNWQRKKCFFNRAFLHKEAVCLAEYSYLNGSAAEAWLCRVCRKVIIDYSHKDSYMNNN